MTTPPDLATIRARLAALLPDLREQYAVESLGIFGSYARGEQTPDSDLDVLVDFRTPPTLYTLGGLLMDLRERLDLPVHLSHAPTLRPVLREAAERDLVSVEP